MRYCRSGMFRARMGGMIAKTASYGCESRGSGSGTARDWPSVDVDISRTPSPGPTSPKTPLAAYPPPQEVGGKSRAPEIYGFVAWASTLIGYFLFLTWALLSPAALDALGWTWYPSREWAVLLPAWSVMLILITYASYLALALARTPSFSETCTITDSRARFPPRIREGVDPYITLMSHETLAIPYDLPIGTVNRMFYAKRPSGPVTHDDQSKED